MEITLAILSLLVGFILGYLHGKKNAREVYFYQSPEVVTEPKHEAEKVIRWVTKPLPEPELEDELPTGSTVFTDEDLYELEKKQERDRIDEEQEQLARYGTSSRT